MSYRYSLFFVFLTMLVVGCASTKPPEQTKQEIIPQKQKQSSPVSTTLAFDPMNLGKDTFSEMLEKISVAKTGSALQTRSGYRIQLGAFIEERAAKNIAESAQSKFSVPVYLQFNPPFHRIRVGDCRTMQEADSLKLIAIEYGYPDAVVTNDNIVSEK
jgi:cell division septation protein DedD